MKLLIIIIGLIFQLGSATCLKLSDGFTNIIPTVLAFAFWAALFGTLMYAFKHFELGFIFAIFAGMGIILATAMGVVYFKEPVSALKVVSIIFIILGVVGLNMSQQ